jgi:hypothetical protein
MKTTFLVAGLLLAAQGLFGQLTENFSDGNFDENPTWSGSSDKFSVTSQVLQLSDSTPANSNTAYLSVAAPTSSAALTTWEFYARLEFAPSTSNYARFYLAASAADLSSPLSGYFVKIGGASGDVDAVILCRQDGDNVVELIEGAPGSVAAQPAQARVRVTRTPGGLWSMWTDTGNGFMLEGETQDASYSMGLYAGVYCRYTSTRNEHFFFDDISIGPLYADTTPPMLVAVNPVHASQLAVRFDEPVAAAFAGQAALYDVSPVIGAPLSALPDVNDPAVVILELAAPLSNLGQYTLTVQSIADLQGNLSGPLSLGFIYYQISLALPGDVLINEIMADPSPALVLPDAEYVELHNRSDKLVDLGGWQIAVGANSRILPSFLLPPSAYVLLCDEADATAFEAFGDVLPVSGFPALTNGGATISLIDTSDAVISRVAYHPDWYGDIFKEDGGWSLELIIPAAPADCPGNWRASQAALQGTPGTANSLLGATPDTTALALERAFATSTTEITLVFNKYLDEAIAGDPTLYEMEGLLIAEALVSNNQVSLLLSAPLLEGLVYTLFMSPELSDCLGNKLSERDSARLGLPEPLFAGDLLLNEVLFNPQTGGEDFVEIWNVSDKIINLSGLRLVNAVGTANREAVIGIDHLVFPGEAAVICAKPDDLLLRYHVPHPERLVEAELPTLEDNQGNITLRMGLLTIDSFDYTDDMHHPLLAFDDGVSLERLSVGLPTNEAANWHSAAGSVGFATPTYENSQRLTTALPTSAKLQLATEVFSPDGDGEEDALLVQFHADNPGNVISVEVFDVQGRPVAPLARNELLGAEAFFRWDGVDARGGPAPAGIYIVWARWFSPDGKVESDKKTCVLAR